MTLRLAHVTDIHWQTPPSAADLLSPKRMLGTANLYLRGRRHHFTREVQSALVSHLQDLQPDLVVISGDLTAQALESEFALARRELAPVLDVVPTLVVPGNHDVYAPDAVKSARMQKHFGPWMHHQGPLARLDLGHVTVLGLNPNAPRLVTSHGVVPEVQLDALRDTLAEPDLKGRSVVLVTHYPVVDRRGALYDGWSHGLINAQALVDVLESAPCRPAMVLHGHVHHGYVGTIALSDTEVPTYDPGSSGYAYMPTHRRAAGMNVYTLEADSHSVERFLFEGDRFRPEPGGPYATGR